MGVGADLVFVESVVNEKSPSRYHTFCGASRLVLSNFLDGESTSAPPAILSVTY